MSVAVRVRSFGARGGFGGAFPGAMPQGQAPLVARLPLRQAPLVARLPPADAQGAPQRELNADHKLTC